MSFFNLYREPKAIIYNKTYYIISAILGFKSSEEFISVLIMIAYLFFLSILINILKKNAAAVNAMIAPINVMFAFMSGLYSY